MKEPIKHKWVISLAVMLGPMMEVIDSSIINIALPNMMGSLGANLDEVTWLVTGYMVANVTIVPISGWLSMRFGRKRYFLVSISLFTIASVLCSFVHNLYLLILIRILQGIGGGALVPTSQAVLMETFPPEEQGTAMSIFGFGMMVCPSLGSIISGWVTDNYNWSWSFYINVPLGILAFFLVLFFIEDPPYLKPAGSRIDYMGFILLAIGIGCLQTVLQKGERADWFESKLITWLSLAVMITLPLFILRELKTDHPVVNLRVLSNRSLWVGTIFTTIIGFGLYGSLVLISVYFQNLLHYTSWETGKFFFYSAAAIAVVMPISGKLLNKISPRYLVGTGVGFFALAIYRMSHFTLETRYEEVFWNQIIRGIGLGLSVAPLNVIALKTLDKKDIPSASGIYNLMRQLGGSFGIAILVALLTRGEAMHRVNLIQHIHTLNPLVVQRLDTLEQGLLARGEDLVSAKLGALKLLDQTVHIQALMLSFVDSFQFLVTLILLSLPLLFLFKKR
ncbi:MAG TPA: DHA2 family efflux MFS transporter permease subunit [Candidatus Limnocylindrales bacterium]|nr:DHA2 family efflux MFS transporter permease subunit [Candidatus Limnocylindrales bacterium]